MRKADHTDLELLIANEALSHIRRLPKKEQSRAWACVAAAITAAGIRTSEEPEWVIATVQATLHEVPAPNVRRRMIEKMVLNMAAALVKRESPIPGHGDEKISKKKLGKKI